MRRSLVRLPTPESMSRERCCRLGCLLRRRSCTPPDAPPPPPFPPPIPAPPGEVCAELTPPLTPQPWSNECDHFCVLNSACFCSLLPEETESDWICLATDTSEVELLLEADLTAAPARGGSGPEAFAPHWEGGREDAELPGRLLWRLPALLQASALLR